ncbi:MAG: GntR family transcriptional regulator [Anaerolineaceae bacterium]
MALKKPESIIDQINQIIRSRIQQGIYSAGSRLPSESALAEEFGVSRTSIRNAMDSLVAEGVVIRRHGDGTFINKRSLQFRTQLMNLWSFPQLIEDSGYTPSTKVLTTNLLPATKEVAAELEITPGSPLLEIQRLFFANNTPVIFSLNLIPTKLIKTNCSASDYSLSIYDFMHQFAAEDLSYSTSDIHSILVDENLSQIFHLDTGTSLIRFNDVFFNPANIPVVLGVNIYNDKFLSLRLVRTRG